MSTNKPVIAGALLVLGKPGQPTEYGVEIQDDDLVLLGVTMNAGQSLSNVGSGKQEHPDESLADTIARETKEETFHTIHLPAIPSITPMRFREGRSVHSCIVTAKVAHECFQPIEFYNELAKRFSESYAVCRQYKAEATKSAIVSAYSQFSQMMWVPYGLLMQAANRYWQESEHGTRDDIARPTISVNEKIYPVLEAFCCTLAAQQVVYER
eukprot:TRINITY_DN4304_c0_g2_i1.p2 TRINITY_DN4304_c0_g2~~TRINITY_DN4304_c0_g2_i1.p2  ORF type:complete len:211 (+),score=27.13 TRINITY_DN4304_c0_g2_i1:1221-1853(+)